MQLFYHEHIESEFELSKDESRHLIKALRKNIGDEIIFTDGKGGKYTCSIIDDNPKQALLSVKEKEQITRNNTKLSIAIAPTKNMDRLEWFLEKATEIGIDEIHLFISEHSERRKVKMERLEKIVVSAMKQSLKFFKPILYDICPIEKLFEKEIRSKKFIAHLNEMNPILMKNVYESGTDAFILIGPEGDFSSKELKLAIKNDYQMVSLGNSRLRTETAGLVACNLFNILNL